MPSSTRSNKETQLLFLPDPVTLERSIRKEARSSSTDNNTCVSLDSAQPPSTQTPVLSTDTRSPLSTDNTHVSSTDIFHPTSIDTPSQTSINTELREMVAPLILVRDNNGDLHDREGHLRNAAGSPCRKSSISWKGGRSLGPILGFLFSGDLERSFIGDTGPGSCMEAGGNNTWAPLRQDTSPSVSLSWIPLKPELILNPGRSLFVKDSQGDLEIFDFLFSVFKKERVRRIFRMHGASHQIIPDLRKMNSDLPSFLASLVGGRVRPRCLFADPFSLTAASHREVPEADNEAILMAPSKQRCSYVLDDRPCSEIEEEDLMAIRRRYAIHSSVQMRSPSEFERAADRGPNEIAVFEAYLVAGFRGIIPSLVAEISSFFGFCPSQLTPLSWRTLMSIQPIRIYEDSGTLLLPTFWHTVDVARPVSFLGEAVAKQVLAISRCFRRVPFLVSKEVLRHSRLWGNIARLPASVLYDEYQQAGTQRRCSFYTPPPHLDRATLPTARIRPDSAGTPTGGVPLMGILQMLLTGLFLLRNRVRDMAAQRDLLIRQVTASARWELMKEWLEGRTEH
ncbi:hypothetical protein F2Q69_00023149 [Brassica cretica]|uniref:Uncharacterized protein n=1 Tax=Brassica cretica TaxID=69181 RepID=A0A8S9Q6A9_BRACR|nr:hypothetical protein F2Q69_00023149 [Brassica cretica]